MVTVDSEGVSRSLRGLLGLRLRTRSLLLTKTSPRASSDQGVRQETLPLQGKGGKVIWQSADPGEGGEI